MTISTEALKELRISVVENGFIVFPRHYAYRDGDCVDCFVFQTVEQMAAWMLKQTWPLGLGLKQTPIEARDG